MRLVECAFGKLERDTSRPVEVGRSMLGGSRDTAIGSHPGKK